MLSGKVIRIRWVKMYPTAHNHVAIGDVLELPADTDWDVRAHVEESGLCVLDNKHKTVITRAMNARPE